MEESLTNSCFLCGSFIRELSNTNERSERLVVKFLKELEQFCRQFDKSGGGRGKSGTEAVKESHDGTSTSDCLPQEQLWRSTCSECFGSMEAALMRKDIVVHAKLSVRMLEEKLMKEMKELERHSRLLLKQMVEIEGKISSSLPSSSTKKAEPHTRKRKRVALELEAEGNEVIWKVIQALNERSSMLDDRNDEDVKIEVPDDQVTDDYEMPLVTDAMTVVKSEDEEMSEDDDVGEPVNSSEGSNSSSEEDEEGSSTCSSGPTSPNPEVDPPSEAPAPINEQEKEMIPAPDSKKLSARTLRRRRRQPEGEKKRRGPRFHDYLKDIDCSGMPEFKKIIIQRTLSNAKRSRIMQRNYLQKLTTHTKRDSDHPSRRYWVDYDPKKDELFVADIKILFQDEPPLLQCSQCSFQANWRPPVQLKPGQKTGKRTTEGVMCQHILRAHFHAFQCPVCLYDSSSYSHYKQHLDNHSKKFICKICGKPMSKTGLSVHKWTHMNDEEKAEAIKAGHKLPERSKPILKTFQCPTCGKTCNSKGNLKAHEHRIHRSFEEKELVICQNCGKQMTKEAYERYHQKTCGYSGPPVQCLQCSKMFKTIELMHLHVKRVHTAEGQQRTVACPQCGKMFRTKTLLNNHKRVHSEDFPFSCTKGCGKGFKWSKSMQRHSRVCEGFGTKPGRKTPNSNAPRKKNINS